MPANSDVVAGSNTPPQNPVLLGTMVISGSEGPTSRGEHLERLTLVFIFALWMFCEQSVFL